MHQKPKRLVAIGNDAEAVLKSMSCSCEVIKVRHPSYGGQVQFKQQILNLYEIEPVHESPRLL